MQYSVDTRVKDGHVEIGNLPFADGAAVTVVFIPKTSLSKMSFKKARKLTKSIKGNLSDDVVSQREEK